MWPGIPWFSIWIPNRNTSGLLKNADARPRGECGVFDGGTAWAVFKQNWH